MSSPIVGGSLRETEGEKKEEEEEKENMLREKSNNPNLKGGEPLVF